MVAGNHLSVVNLSSYSEGHSSRDSLENFRADFESAVGPSLLTIAYHGHLLESLNISHQSPATKLKIIPKQVPLKNGVKFNILVSDMSNLFQIPIQSLDI